MSSHHQLLYHIVFSVKDRRPLLQSDDLREQTWAYMSGVAKNLNGFAIKIGGYHDHVHLLVRIPAKLAVADFVGKIKANTSKQINESRKSALKFNWQDGYGAFICCCLRNIRFHTMRLIYGNKRRLPEQFHEPIQPRTGRGWT